MRVLLADDHAIVRSGLRHIVADAFPGALVGEVGSCEELREWVREAEWSVLVLDISLGDGNGLDLVPEIRRMRPAMPIVVLTMHGEQPFVVRALRAGVMAYVTKERAPEELLQAIRTVMQGRRYLGEGVAGRIADHVAQGGAAGGRLPHEDLSAREMEVFLGLARGETVSEIAERLDLSVKTVSTYRTRILEKIGVDSNARLMRYALEHGLGM